MTPTVGMKLFRVIRDQGKVSLKEEVVSGVTAHHFELDSRSYLQTIIGDTYFLTQEDAIRNYASRQRTVIAHLERARDNALEAIDDVTSLLEQ
jgi:hypothetical protein